jgi:hypothetical protein
MYNIVVYTMSSGFFVIADNDDRPALLVCVEVSPIVALIVREDDSPLGFPYHALYGIPV